MEMITSNAISKLVQVAGVDSSFSPIVQVVSLKQVGNSNDRYRAVLSDGIHFVQGMLSKQLTSMVHAGELRDNSIVQLQECLKNEVSGRLVIILLNLRVLDNPGQRIGAPIDIEPSLKSGQLPSAQPMHAQPLAQPLYNSTNSAPMANNYVKRENKPAIGSPNRGNPYGAATSPRGDNPYGSSTSQRYQPPIERSMNVDGTTITPIAGLNIYNSRWTIKARLTTKSDVRTWSNAKGEGSLFSIELLDNSGVDIRGTFFKEGVDKFYNMLIPGKVYRISGGRLKVANMQYNTCKSSFEITFDQNTEIHLDDDDGAIAAAHYDFVKIGDLEHVEPNKSVDVLAIVKSVGDVSHIVSKKTGQEMGKCDLILVDDSGTEITLTVWREKAETAPRDFANHPVVAFRRARLSEYGGRSLSAGASTDINPQIPEAQQLVRWWQTVGSTGAATRSLSARSGGGGQVASLVERKNIEAIREENLGHINVDKGDYIAFKGTITFFKKDREGGAWYPACANAGEPCKNRFKVTPTTDGQWQCDKCHNTYGNCVRRWIFSGVVEDSTSSTWVSFFNEQAETLLGVTADEAFLHSHPEGSFDQNAYDSLYAPALFSDWVFRCRVKNELVNEENRVKTSVVGMWPVDYLRESKDLLAAIANF
ncbi:replication factor A1 [Fistulifera solaris]|uniref:Replication protein A subunit n=1 Tax=Fistulifera solaris TaxID=1519565 RepID=A0A1Z5KMS4_FISSO|nr:replication factor A1 [Fistulifera solaris]|eukprot:GAX27362.1 replication factor A1 [Fistulifera solaris]